MLHKAMQDLKSGEKVELYVTDPSAEKDIDNFCKFLGHILLNKDILIEN